MDGAHGIERCEVVTAQVLEEVFAQLDAHRVRFEGMLLKPNMVIPGKKCARQASVQEVAIATIRCLALRAPSGSRHRIPVGWAERARSDRPPERDERLGPHPWEVSFSYGRALQEPVLAIWKGQEENVAAAQQALRKRCQLNGLARDGKYSRSMEAAEISSP